MKSNFNDIALLMLKIGEVNEEEMKKKIDPVLIKYMNQVSENRDSCVSKESHIVAVPMLLAQKELGHANMIVINYYKRHIERFEPHGPNLYFSHKEYSEEIKQGRLLSTHIDDLLQKWCDENDYTYFGPSALCPTFGFQNEQFVENENNNNAFYDDTCAIWSIWYLQTRLKHLDMDAPQVTRAYFDEIKNNKELFSKVILNYETEILYIIEEFADELKLDKMDIGHMKNFFRLILNWNNRPK
jgi:hypothetical protein